MWWIYSVLVILGLASLGLWAYWDEFDYWYEYQLKPKIGKPEENKDE